MENDKRENIFTLRIPEIGYEGSVSVKVRKRKCRIGFDVDKTDYKNGIFGFCEYSNSLKNNLKDKNKASALQAEFPPENLEIEGKPYYASWISMRKGDKITLELDWERKLFKNFNSHLEDYTTIAFDTHPDFTFSVTDLRDPNKKNKGIEEIEITCNATNETPTRLEIKTNNTNVVGVLNVFHPAPKKAKVRWFVVENNGGSKDNDETRITGQKKLNINLTYLKDIFKKAFNPALIDIDFVNPSPIILDITTLPAALEQKIQAKITADNKTQKELETEIKKFQKENTNDLNEKMQKLIKERDKYKETDKQYALIEKKVGEINDKIHNLLKDPVYKSNFDKFATIKNSSTIQNKVLEMAKNKKNIFVTNTTDQIERSNDRTAFMKLLKELYTIQHNAAIEEDTVYLFLTYLQCKGDTTEEGDERVNGTTNKEEKSCLIFTKNKDADDHFDIDIPHEVMHALGLEHTFDKESQHVFSMGGTDNYMDYKNTAKHTFVWQWQLLHESALTN